MRKYWKKKLLLIASILILVQIFMGHSGGLDSSGGHRDNRNRSGLGSYHYHCWGHPPHLHEHGGCPYDDAVIVEDEEPTEEETEELLPEYTPIATDAKMPQTGEDSSGLGVEGYVAFGIMGIMVILFIWGVIGSIREWVKDRKS